MDSRKTYDPTGLSCESRNRLNYPEPICNHAEACRQAIDVSRRLQMNREIT